MSERALLSTPKVLALLAAFLLPITALLPTPAAAQQVLVQNGATVQVSSSGVFDLQGAELDFGGVGATATLDEQGEGRVAGGQLKATRNLSSPSSFVFQPERVTG